MSSTEIKIPKLVTAQVGPVQPLEKALLEKQATIEAWFRQQFLNTPPAVYGSVDLRNAGFKLAPVDMNLYPAGFNNLNPELLPLAIQSAQALISQRYPQCKSIVLIPENHSRNLFYWENVSIQLSILRNAGFEVRVGADPEFFPEAKTMELSAGKTVLIEPLTRKNNRVTLPDFNPQIVWLNNDFSSGIPDYLKNIEQPICPPMELGWHSRLKSVHFDHYRNVVADFSKIIDMDPWFLDPLFYFCDKIDFMQREGQERLASSVEQLLIEIQKKYDQYNIKHEPFVIVKADAGTYGMSVMSIKSADEIRHLNRKQRTSMSASKGSQTVHRVIIQEGVYSFETWGEKNSAAEPVVYMLGQHVIGGFYRLHENKNSTESLNAPGMKFEPLKIDNASDTPNRFYAYSVVGRLSMLAAAREQQELKK
ncbi:MAG: glutamate--cysteine ligase [Pseudomonadota bacterium]